MNGHLSCFQYLVLMNSVAVNIFMHTLVFCPTPEMELLSKRECTFLHLKIWKYQVAIKPLHQSLLPLAMNQIVSPTSSTTLIAGNEVLADLIVVN